MPGMSQADPTSVLPPRGAWNGARAAHDPMPGRVVTSPAAKRRATIDKVTTGVREGTGRLVTTIKGWPRKQQLIAGGGAVAVLVLLIVVISSGGDDKTGQPVAGPTSAAPVNASFDTQIYNAKGVSVKVPKSWKKTTGGSYVDYVDPDDSKHKARILVENGSGSAESFLKIAANGLKGNKTSCPTPYKQIGVTPKQISGHDGAVLEYKCGSGDSERHALWGAVVTGGHAYSFFVTSTEDQFDASKPIFDEMVSSYKLSS
jgi:hypothetical protein